MKNITQTVSAHQLTQAEANLSFLCEPTTQTLIDTLQGAKPLALHQIVKAIGRPTRSVLSDLRRLIACAIVELNGHTYAFDHHKWQRLMVFARAVNAEAPAACTVAQ